MPCTGSVAGEFRLDGLDLSAVTLTGHQLGFAGPQFVNRQLAGFGSYAIEPVVEGVYTITQSSSFAAPYDSLQYANTDGVAVGAGTIFDAVHSVGTSHGLLQLAGSWSLNDAVSATITAAGTVPGSTESGMSANDFVDPATGNFDLVLAVGDWDINGYAFRFESLLNGRTFSQSLKLDYAPGTIVPIFSIMEGGVIDLVPVALQTASAQVQLDVAQVGSAS